ncbi:MAG: competence/damage-inducible protein A [Hyphomicrobiaceae bacterium]|nr:competence/damage-inducible protein A [Hyphomicrobiaceae bacterium]
MRPTPATAAILVIGDEVLSGKVKDKNIGQIAEMLALIGIDLVEARIVGDREEAIIAALDALRLAHTYVFTSGGIGPTHDDITADAVARAFGVPIDVREDARAILVDWYDRTGRELNEARLRMARIPQGASLIENPVSGAPGFRIANVHVMAGVPSILRAMMENVLPTLEGGVPVHARSLPLACAEADIAAELRALQDAHPGIAIGSYPKMVLSSKGPTRFWTEIVVRGRDADLVEIVAAQVESLAPAMKEIES